MTASRIVRFSLFEKVFMKHQGDFLISSITTGCGAESVGPPGTLMPYLLFSIARLPGCGGEGIAPGGGLTIGPPRIGGIGPVGPGPNAIGPPGIMPGKGIPEPPGT